MPDKSVRYVRQAIRRYKCGDERYSIQYERIPNFHDEIESFELDDVFLLRIFGRFAGLSGSLEESYELVRKCMSQTVLSIANFEKPNMDYTRCDADKQCGLGINLRNMAVPMAVEIEEEKKIHGIKCEGTICKVIIPNGPTFTGMDNNGVVEFRGLPYAMAPTGERRFKAPVIKYYGQETVNGFEYGKTCATHQVNDERSEDCLKVNIAVSRQALDERSYVPIVYYIHGGGYNHGSNQIELNNLILDQGVMVISIAYRLGVWGFLHLPEVEPDQEFQANWGMLDIIAALEWSQVYAPYFGGNIDEGTLSGCSSGGEAIWWLLTAEKAWPYFKRANIMGTGLNTAYEAKDAQVQSYTILMII